MENQHLINMFLGIGMTVVGWFARELWAAVKELKADLAKLCVYTTAWKTITSL